MFAPPMVGFLGALLATLCNDVNMRCDMPGVINLWTRLQPQTQKDLGQLVLAMKPYVDKCKTNLYSECTPACRGADQLNAVAKQRCSGGCNFYKEGCLMLKNLITVAQQPPKPQPNQPSFIQSNPPPTGQSNPPPTEQSNPPPSGQSNPPPTGQSNPPPTTP
jgi:hypothetical protein